MELLLAGIAGLLLLFAWSHWNSSRDSTRVDDERLARRAASEAERVKYPPLV